MALTWDLTNIKDSKQVCWIETDEKNDKGEPMYDLNPITNVLIWGSMFVGMDIITEKTYKEFHKRLIEMEIVTGSGMLRAEKTGDNETTYLDTRQPTLEEIQLHIGLKTNASRMESRKWGSNLRRIVKEEAEKRIRKMEQTHEKQVGQT